MTLSAEVAVTPIASGCANAPGPFVTLEGTVTVASLRAELIFRNNQKGTHETTETASVNVEPLAEEVLTIPKQPVEGGVGGNPFIWMQSWTGGGEALTDEILLGRCVQDL